MEIWGKGLDVLSNLGKSLKILYQIKCSHYIVVLPHEVPRAQASLIPHIYFQEPQVYSSLSPLSLVLSLFPPLASSDPTHRSSALIHPHHDVIPIINHYPSPNHHYLPDYEFVGHSFSNIILLRVSISYNPISLAYYHKNLL